MTDIEALKTSIANREFCHEPLAEAIMHYLGKENPEASRQIQNLFDEIISRNIDNLIHESKDS